MSCAKYFLFIVNFICWVISVALLGLAVAVLANVDKIKELFPVQIEMVPISIIIAMGVIFIISFSGCLGAIKESKGLLITYTILLIVLLGGQAYLSYIVLSLVLNDEFPGQVKDWLNDAFKHKQQEFHVLEKILSCCGTSGFEAYDIEHQEIPPICCDTPSDNKCERDFYSGCTQMLQENFYLYATIEGYVGVGIMAVELLAVVAALTMICSISKNKQRGKMYA